MTPLVHRLRLTPIAIGLALVLPCPVGAQPALTGSTGTPPPQLLLKTLERRLGTNPFDPVSLNNLAVIKLSEDDPYAAAELLSRAQRLAPDNHVIAQNQARLTEWLGAKLAPEGAVPAATATAPQLPPEPPALWPRP